MGFIFGAKLSALKKAGKLRVVVKDKAVLLVYFKNTVYGIKDACPHMKASLFKGTIEAGIVTCPRHGAKIDVTTGAIQEKAKVLLLRVPTKHAQPVVTKVTDDDVFILV